MILARVQHDAQTSQYRSVLPQRKCLGRRAGAARDGSMKSIASADEMPSNANL
jgi:hypothetical protein